MCIVCGVCLVGRGFRLVAVEVADAGRLSVPELLAAGEQSVNLALGGGEGRVYSFYGVAGEDALILGLYNRLPDESGLVGVYRRVTGGRPIPLGEGEGYAAVVAPAASLGETVEMAAALGECTSARGWGATRIEGWGVIELLAASEPSDCLGRLFRLDGMSRVFLRIGGLGRIASAYRSPSWRFYGPPKPGGSIVSEECSRDGYHVGVTLDVFEEYVAESWLYGIFHAAPPMEPFSVMATLRGTRLDEMVLANLEVALEHRVELYGITVGDVVELLRKLSSRINMASHGS
jgi:hypothetical protein